MMQLILLFVVIAPLFAAEERTGTQVDNPKTGPMALPEFATRPETPAHAMKPKTNNTTGADGQAAKENALQDKLNRMTSDERAAWTRAPAVLHDRNLQVRTASQ